MSSLFRGTVTNNNLAKNIYKSNCHNCKNDKTLNIPRSFTKNFILPQFE